MILIFLAEQKPAYIKMNVSLNEAWTPSHINSHTAGDNGWQGGMAAIYNSNLLIINIKPKSHYSSFESLSSILHSSNKLLNSVEFVLDEFSEFVSNCAVTKDYIGDFNIHVDMERDNFEVCRILLSSECSHS